MMYRVSKVTVRLLLVFVLVAASLALMPAQEAHAATTRTITVGNYPDSDSHDFRLGDPPDDGKCTLREAIMAANLSKTGSYAGCTIAESGSGTPVTYVLNLPAYTHTLRVLPLLGHEDMNWDGDLDIEATVSDKNITINGQGVGSTIIDGGGAERVFDIDPQYHGHIIVTINDMTIQNGREMSGMGGCVNDVSAGSDEDVTYLNNVVLSGCRARNGGAVRIRNSTMYIENSTITGSQANKFSGIGGEGGAIIVEYGTMTISGSTITGSLAESRGGAIYHTDGSTVGSTVYVEDSTITGNRSVSDGGGIFTISVGALVTTNVGNSTISNNTVDGGWGGGIANNFDCTTTITGTSVYSNAVVGGGGGGIYNGGTLKVVNSTISTNKSEGGGGGVYNEHVADLSFVTITANVADFSGTSGGDGGGVARTAGTLTVKNSIIGINTDVSGGAPDCSGSINFEGSNLLYNNLGCVPGGGGTYSVAYDPKLDTWKDNGGPTYTHALLSDSPAIDTAPNCTDLVGNPVGTDQRGTGYSRPADGDKDGTPECDLGAYEVQSSSTYLPLILLGKKP